jgi:hypothetical protein
MDEKTLTTEVVEIDPGHIYLLDNLDGNGSQKITFVKRVGDGYPFNQPPSFEGTTCQRTIKANILRVNYLQNQFWCVENVIILFCLKIAIWCFEFRASRRKGQILLVNPLNAWSKSKCTKCGHIKCNHVNNQSTLLK